MNTDKIAAVTFTVLAIFGLMFLAIFLWAVTLRDT